jgi:hypothetical protein
MNGAVLQHILSRDPYTCCWFKGFTTRDLSLPEKFSKPALFILNTDVYNGPGEHWCVLIIFNKSRGEFFDSYGNAPSFFGFDHLFEPHCKNIKHNTVRLQGLEPVCGHHCLYYALNRARGTTLNQLLNKFYSVDNLKFNDRLVYKFVKKFGNKFAELD